MTRSIHFEHLPDRQGMTETSTTRRGTAVAGKIPVLSMPSGPAATRAPLVRGAIPRKADMRVPIRVQQSGGEPIHSAPTRRRDPRARPPPPCRDPHQGGVAAATPASRPFVLASLRALRLDPGAPSPAHSHVSTKPFLAWSRPKRSFALIIDRPFHNSLGGWRADGAGRDAQTCPYSNERRFGGTCSTSPISTQCCWPDSSRWWRVRWRGSCGGRSRRFPVTLSRLGGPGADPEQLDRARRDRRSVLAAWERYSASWPWRYGRPALR